MDKYRTRCKFPHETCDMLNVGNRTPERRQKNLIGDPFPEGISAWEIPNFTDTAEGIKL